MPGVSVLNLFCLSVFSRDIIVILFSNSAHLFHSSSKTVLNRKSSFRGNSHCPSEPYKGQSFQGHILYNHIIQLGKCPLMATSGFPKLDNVEYCTNSVSRDLRPDSPCLAFTEAFPPCLWPRASFQSTLGPSAPSPAGNVFTYLKGGTKRTK